MEATSGFALALANIRQEWSPFLSRRKVGSARSIKYHFLFGPYIVTFAALCLREGDFAEAFFSRSIA
jgi:hypothetical protein